MLLVTWVRNMTWAKQIKQSADSKRSIPIYWSYTQHVSVESWWTVALVWCSPLVFAAFAAINLLLAHRRPLEQQHSQMCKDWSAEVNYGISEKVFCKVVACIHLGGEGWGGDCTVDVTNCIAYLISAKLLHNPLFHVIIMLLMAASLYWTLMTSLFTNQGRF